MTAEAVDAALQQARMYLDVDNHQRAREVLAHALSMAPDHPALLIFDAQAAIGLGDYIGAERRLYAALKSAPDNEHAIRLYALALRGQGRWHEAKWMAWRAVCADPNEYRTHLVYAHILSDEGWLNAALAEVTSEQPALRDGLVTASVSRRDGTMVEALRRLDDAGVEVADLTLRRPTLDEAFLQLTGPASTPPATATAGPTVDEVSR